MELIQGIVTIVQESRFQLLDDNGVGHQFLLSHRAALEPEQLAGLPRAQTRVRVWYYLAPDIIGHVAARIDLEKPQQLTIPPQPSTAAGHARETAPT